MGQNCGGDIFESSLHFKLQWDSCMLTLHTVSSYLTITTISFSDAKMIIQGLTIICRITHEIDIPISVHFFIDFFRAWAFYLFCGDTLSAINKMHSPCRFDEKVWTYYSVVGCPWNWSFLFTGNFVVIYRQNYCTCNQIQFVWGRLMSRVCVLL